MAEMSNKKNYLLTLFTSVVTGTISSLIGLLSVPISLNYWGVERYGIWAIITSILVYLNISNLGLSASASILIAKNNKFQDKIKILKRAFNILILITIVLGSFFIIVNIYYKEWILLLGKIPPWLETETYKSCFLLGIFFFINLPFSLISSVILGFQKLYVEKIFSLCQAVSNFLSLLLVIHFKGNLVTFAVYTGLSTLLLNIIKFIYYYFFIYLKTKHVNNIRQNIDCENNYETSYKIIFTTGIRFFLMGLGATLVWNTDNFIISHFIGVEEVTPYSIIFRLYYILFNIIFMINNSILPIMGKEAGSNNWEWINKTYNSLLIIVSITGGFTWLIGLLFFKDIILIWVGKKGYAGLLTVLALGAYSYLLSMVNLNSGIMYSFNYLKRMYLLSWLEALINISSSIMLLKHFGLGGVAMGTFLGSLLTCSWILPLLIVKRNGNRIKYNRSFILTHFFLLLLPLVIVGIFVQIYVSVRYLRIIFGCTIVLLYLAISYMLMPVEVKIFLNNLLPKNYTSKRRCIGVKFIK